METLKQCPQCHRLPEITVRQADGHQTTEMIWFDCLLHGHSACGSDEQDAISHWNHYVTWLVRDNALLALTTDGGFDQSFCPFCRKPTPSRHLLGSICEIRCLVCYLVKYFGHLEVVL